MPLELRFKVVASLGHTSQSTEHCSIMNTGHSTNSLLKKFYLPRWASNLLDVIVSDFEFDVQVLNEFLVPVSDRHFGHARHFSDFALGAALAAEHAGDVDD